MSLARLCNRVGQGTSPLLLVHCASSKKNSAIARWLFVPFEVSRTGESSDSAASQEPLAVFPRRRSCPRPVHSPEDMAMCIPPSSPRSSRSRCKLGTIFQLHLAILVACHRFQTKAVLFSPSDWSREPQLFGLGRSSEPGP